MSAFSLSSSWFKLVYSAFLVASAGTSGGDGAGAGAGAGSGSGSEGSSRRFVVLSSEVASSEVICEGFISI